MKNWNPIRGSLATYTRETTSISLYFGVYGLLKEHNVHSALAGGITGVSAWMFNYPLDVLKSRM